TVRPSAGHDGSQSAQRLERAGPAGAVSRNADVALELAQRLARPGTEDTVDPADIEPEFGQAALKCNDVVTSERVADDVRQQPVTQAPAGFVEHPVGRGVDDAGRGESPLLLELPDGAIDVFVERTGTRCGVVEQPESGALGANLGDRWTGVTQLIAKRGHPPQCPPRAEVGRRHVRQPVLAEPARTVTARGRFYPSRGEESACAPLDPPGVRPGPPRARRDRSRSGQTCDIENE